MEDDNPLLNLKQQVESLRQNARIAKENGDEKAEKLLLERARQINNRITFLEKVREIDNRDNN